MGRQRFRSNKMVKFSCTGCGNVEERPLNCRYTGMRHGTGFKYVCNYCRSDMELVEGDTE
jgi:hypothetical protein